MKSSIYELRKSDELGTELHETSQGVQEVGPYDVLCGNHPDAVSNVGNFRFRVTLDLAIEQFKTAKSNKDRTNMIKRVTDIVQSTGGRFLIRTRNSWSELEPRETNDKVGYALRERAVALSSAKEFVQLQKFSMTLPSSRNLHPSMFYKKHPVTSVSNRPNHSGKEVTFCLPLPSRLDRQARSVPRMNDSADNSFEPIQWPPRQNENCTSPMSDEDLLRALEGSVLYKRPRHC